MDSLSIDYEPLVWDLNPEGIGVQPMIANVTISFKFIGGSALMGPINKLQNALSFNYFANAQVYDPRADYLSINKPPNKIKKVTVDGVTTEKEFESPLSPTGYYLNNIIDDLYKGDVNKFIDGGIETTEDIIDNTPNLDQEKLNEDVNSGEQTLTDNNVPVAIVEPKLESIDYVSIYNNSENEYFLNIGIKQSGIVDNDYVNNTTQQLLSDEELEKFIRKGIKLELNKIDFDVNGYKQEIIQLSPYTANKSFFDITDKRYNYYFGSLNMKNDITVNLSEGVYILTLSYNGEKINSINIPVKNNEPWNMG